MNYLESLQYYLESKLIKFSFENNLLNMGEKVFHIADSDERIFDEELDFLPKSEKDVDGIVYNFGGRWYINENGPNVTLEELKYMGDANQKIVTESFLGIRSGYEIGNGLGNYSSYVKKAKFLNIKSLGICEKNTLAGALNFQESCVSNGIKSIIGMTLSVRIDDDIFDIKTYAKNFQGWLSLLKFNTEINVNESNHISVDFLRNNSEDVFVVADPKSMVYEKCLKIIDLVDFYQLDTVKFLNEEKDIWYIDNLEKFILSKIEPISITDSFYLEKEDYETREFLWSFLKKFDDRTDNQYFKNKDQYAKELITLFEKEDKRWINLFKRAVANEKILVENCNFKYDVDSRHLPKYEMTSEESSKFETKEKLFIHLIREGLKSKGLNIADYLDRLKEEIDVLKSADVIDYFLSQYDVMRIASDKGMLTGIGRGSAGGCLIAYLLGITQINPLDFDLLFERFLNRGRMGFFEDRDAYEIETDNGEKIVLKEGDFVRIIRDNKETVIEIENLKENDTIIRY